jgi:hypothetical protein
MANKGWCNSSTKNGNITTINVCKSSKSNYPSGSDRNGISHSSNNHGHEKLPHNQTVHHYNDYKAGAITDIKSIAGFHCNADKKLAFEMRLGALLGGTIPAPCEYKACIYDDMHQSVLKSVYNKHVRDIFDSIVNGKVSDVSIEKQIQDLNEKIIDGDLALRFK